jgi:hypothetical protein
VEAGRKVVAVKIVALGRVDGAELGAGGAANAAGVGLDGLAERAELLSVVPVRAEGGVGGKAGPGGREGAGGRGRVRLRGRVDVGYSIGVVRRWLPPARLMEGFLDGEKLRRTGICALAEEANRRSALGVRSSLAQDASGKHGWMVCCW